MNESEVQTTVVKLDKEEARLLRWVQSAQAKDKERPVLNGVNRSGCLMASDGFRLHAVKTEVDDFDGIPDGNSELGKVPAAGSVIKVTPNDLSYPETHQIMPLGPVFRVGVNPRLLIDALKGMDKDKVAVLQFYSPDTSEDAQYSKPFEVYGRMDETPVYALVMPMSLGSRYNEVTPSDWRPGRDNA